MAARVQSGRDDAPVGGGPGFLILSGREEQARLMIFHSSAVVLSTTAVLIIAGAELPVCRIPDAV